MENWCFQLKGNYFDMEFVLAFWTRLRKSLHQIGKGYSCGNLCFLFETNYFKRRIFVFPFSVGVKREFECVGGKVKDGKG